MSTDTEAFEAGLAVQRAYKVQHTNMSGDAERAQGRAILSSDWLNEQLAEAFERGQSKGMDVRNPYRKADS